MKVALSALFRQQTLLSRDKIRVCREYTALHCNEPLLSNTINSINFNTIRCKNFVAVYLFKYLRFQRTRQNFCSKKLLIIRTLICECRLECYWTHLDAFSASLPPHKFIKVICELCIVHSIHTVALNFFFWQFSTYIQYNLLEMQCFGCASWCFQ